jgi:hypothetical protein
MLRRRHCGADNETITFKLDVNPSNMQQGKILRPWPWPSFVTKQPSTSRSDIIEPPRSTATALRRHVLPYLTSLPFPFTLEVFWLFSLGSGHAGSLGHCEVAPYPGTVSRVVTTLVPPPVTRDTSDDKASCASITVYQRFIFNESSEVSLATTELEMMHLLTTQYRPKDFTTSLWGVQIGNATPTDSGLRKTSTGLRGEK